MYLKSKNEKKYFMKKTFCLLILIIFFVACNNNFGDDKSQDTFANSQLSIDSVKNIDSATAIDNTLSDTMSEVNTQKISLPDLSGRHNLTLQWISWDRPGKINFIRTDTPNVYIVKGEQINSKTGYMKIEGNIKTITPLELVFDGTITINLTGPYDEGIECQKTGKQIFLSTKNRKYWRMQNMKSCYNNGTTDYIDIYF